MPGAGSGTVPIMSDQAAAGSRNVETVERVMVKQFPDVFNVDFTYYGDDLTGATDVMESLASRGGSACRIAPISFGLK